MVIPHLICDSTEQNNNDNFSSYYDNMELNNENSSFNGDSIELDNNENSSSFM